MVKLHRQRNRTVSDIFGNKFQSKVKMELLGLQQKIVVYCRKNHRWLNRTGALEASLAWEEPTFKGQQWTGIVRAGGWSKAKYTFDPGIRKGAKRMKGLRRYQRGQGFQVRRGMGLFVNYAYWVEKKGFPVLIQGLERYRKEAVRILGHRLQIRRMGLQ